MIAFQCTMKAFMLHDHAERAHHDAGPACDAFLLVDPDVSSLFVFANPAGYAGLDAERIIAMPALECKGSVTVGCPSFVNQFNMNPLLRQHLLTHRLHQPLGFGMLNSTR
jgi:hypothetical protein